MIRLRATDVGSLNADVSLEGVSVFLDQFALYKLATGNGPRRSRFTQAMRTGGDLIFSVANAAELSGLTGKSFDAVKELLRDLGAKWFPIEMDPKAVSDREISGLNRADSFVSKKFVSDFTQDRFLKQPQGEVMLSERFFDLSWVMDWLGPQRDSVISTRKQLDEVLRERVLALRVKFETDANWLDTAFPNVSYNAQIPGTFAYAHVMRGLIVEAKSHHLKKGDGIDFCQAVLASSIATVATLDKHWKRRIEQLPKPNGLARIYYASELDSMVEDFEARVKLRRALKGSAPEPPATNRPS